MARDERGPVMVARGITRRSLLGAALALPAIHGAGATCSSPALRIRVRHDFQTFDPADATGDDAIISRNVLAPLVRYKRRSGTENWSWEKHLVSSIAKENERSYSFTLRDEGWTGQNNIAAGDVAFSFERIAGRHGIQAYNQWIWADLESVDVADSQSATIRLARDAPNLLTEALPNVAGCVVNQAHVSGLAERKFTLEPGPTRPEPAWPRAISDPPS